MEQTFLTLESITAIWEQHGLPCPQQIRLLEKGRVNPIVIVDESLVLKINSRDPELPKLAREQFCMNVLAKQGLPVAACFALDTSRTLIPYDYLIMSRLPGTDLQSVWPTLSATNRQKLVEEAAEILSQIHRVELPAFGALPGTGLAFAEWSQYLQHRMRHFLEIASACKAVPLRRAQMIASCFDNLASSLQEVRYPVLVHADFHLGNLLTDGRKITGVIDFEWAYAGDPEADLAEAFSNGLAWSTLHRSYRSQHPESDTLPQKQILYRILKHLELVGVAAIHWGPERLKQQQEVLKKWIHYATIA